MTQNGDDDMIDASGGLANFIAILIPALMGDIMVVAAYF